MNASVIWRYVIGLLLVGMIACHPQAEHSAMADFEAFFERFHRDSLYQMQHITFPLEGLPADVDEETLRAGNFRWEADDWVIQRPFNFSNGEFSRELISFGSDLVIEKIVHHSGKYGSIRRFAKMGNEWYLIYYAGMNRIE